MSFATKFGYVLAIASVIAGLWCCFLATLAFTGVLEHAVADRWREIITTEAGIESQKQAYGIAWRMAVDSSHLHRWWHAIAGVLLVLTGCVLMRVLIVRNQSENAP